MVEGTKLVYHIKSKCDFFFFKKNLSRRIDSTQIFWIRINIIKITHLLLDIWIKRHKKNAKAKSKTVALLRWKMCTSLIFWAWWEKYIFNILIKSVFTQSRVYHHTTAYAPTMGIFPKNKNIVKKFIVKRIHPLNEIK